MTAARASSRAPVRPIHSKTTITTTSGVGKDVLPCEHHGDLVMPAELDEEDEGDDVRAEDQEVEPMRTAPDP